MFETNYYVDLMFNNGLFAPSLVDFKIRKSTIKTCQSISEYIDVFLYVQILRLLLVTVKIS